MKHKKNISHREVITKFPQTEQVDGKEGSKHKKNKSDKESFSESIQSEQVDEKQESLKHRLPVPIPDHF